MAYTYSWKPHLCDYPPTCRIQSMRKRAPKKYFIKSPPNYNSNNTFRKPSYNTAPEAFAFRTVVSAEQPQTPRLVSPDNLQSGKEAATWWRPTSMYWEPRLHNKSLALRK